MNRSRRHGLMPGLAAAFWTRRVGEEIIPQQEIDEWGMRYTELGRCWLHDFRDVSEILFR